MTVPHPYADLPPEAFWRSAVAERGPLGLERVWTPRVPLAPGDRIATFGSCFAQHIGQALRARGYAWHDAEPAPETLSPANARRFHYGLFSGRTGNIYTTSLLLQWVRWATNAAPFPKEQWEADGRIIDPFRPAIEPGGFASRIEMLASRERAARALRECITTARCFVFTLGLTESWVNVARGYEYPLCPGTAGGAFDPKIHRFRNQDYATVLANLEEAIGLMRAVNSKLRFILTVSPVPLAATASGNHVLVATMASKAILRAVAAKLSTETAGVNYFPAYELVAGTPTRGMFFAPNQRAIAPDGVAFVMRHFFAGIEGEAGAPPPPSASAPTAADIACEEELLEAFGR